MTILNKSLKGSYILITAIVFITAALYTRDFYEININKMYFVALAVIPSLLMSYSSLVNFIFFLFPLTSGLPGNFIFPLLIILLLLKKRDAFDWDGIYCFMIVLTMELLHYVTYDFAINWPLTVGYSANLFFLFYMVTLKDKIVDYEQCLMFFCIGLAVFLFAIFYITQINGGVEMLLESSFRLGRTKRMADVDEKTIMLCANPNGLAFFALVGMATVIVLYSMKKISAWIMIVFLVIYLYVGALSVSRTFFVCLIMILALLSIFSQQSQGKLSWTHSFLLFALIAIALYFIMNNDILYNSYTSRFNDASTQTAGSRFELLIAYNNFLLDNPAYLLAGTGAVHINIVVDTIKYASHNGLQQILVAYGLPGLVFFITITFSAIKKSYKKKAPVCLIPFITTFLYVQSGQLLNPSNNLYLFIVSFYVMKLSMSNNKQNTRNVVLLNDSV